MKYQIHRAVDRDHVAKLLPAPLRSLVPGSLLAEEVYTLIVFRSTVRVVHSSTVEHALKDVGPEAERVLAVAIGFTADALEILRVRNALILSLNDYHWTDESHEAINVLIGAKVKAPQHR
ncbi:MAG: hypothetical protein QOF89_3790 [Acidobacteriota bacterium]|jgi:hypothetical protein|nr:hypothetical protein [Acidobacteriota bacterium]